ncbi:MAG: phosphatase PAP2 family protein [Parcubacteria group bacterium]
MDAFFIFGAKYLFIISVLVGVAVFYTAPLTERYKIATFFALSMMLAFLLSLLARELYFNPRPFVVGKFAPLIPHSADNGFPSDHTLLVSSIAAGMMYFRRRLALVLWLVAGLVAMSRVYTGVHHTLDVLGAALIALLSAVSVHVFLARYKNGIVDEITKK